MSKCITYYELKKKFFFEAYDWCRKRFHEGKIFKWNKDFDEWKGALDSLGNSFDNKIENLMINVIYIIANGARNILNHQIIFNEIQLILTENNLNNLLKDLNVEEKEEFLYDLNLILNNRGIEE
ncbi:hypothetical protein QV08_08945 [Gallibacterium salpingitidis]|uniref:hypothetical protein n=1 Tax=Gallibacterium salpingitidis TaxID=505341 RepID=UPI0008060266|nr:hypothetical protein [Gallibacterium salpingitidis]OBX06850.1 hypothetical protein QV08_08945 [Gallibacterium salpingitidis]WKT00162.1 hypothetical protein NYR30_02335 [Gallibacterium salpingitidis]